MSLKTKSGKKKATDENTEATINYHFLIRSSNE